MNTFIVDRIQTGGAGNLNIPQEKIFELGNYQSVAIVRDTPDLSFSLDCLDVNTEVEALLTGSANPGADAAATVYDLAVNKPVDVISPFKSATGAFNIVKGVAVPYLTLESASYRYGLRENAGEQFTLKGDSIFYVPGTPYQENFTGNAVLTAFTYANTALKYVEQGVNIYALSVTVDGVRKVLGTDYTANTTGVTFTTAPANAAKIRIVYGSATAATYLQAVHEGVSVKPGAIRGKDIKVYVGGTLTSPTIWSDVQSVNIDWRQTLEDDFEFGNPRAVTREATDVPAVTGTIELKAVTPAALFTKLEQITGVTSGDVIGPNSSVAVPLQVRLLNPDSGGTTAVAAGTVLKTLYVSDARFTIPGYEGRANQKLTSSLPFESDGGNLHIYKGQPV